MTRHDTGPTCSLCGSQRTDSGHGYRWCQPCRLNKARLYKMVGRCHNPNDRDFRYYGARGITVCPEWRLSYEAFFRDMGHSPDGMTLDRKDGAKGYSKDNCRWATHAEQMANAHPGSKPRSLCRLGHSLDGSNLGVDKSGRYCKQCRAQWRKDRRQRP